MMKSVFDFYEKMVRPSQKPVEKEDESLIFETTKNNNPDMEDPTSQQVNLSDDRIHAIALEVANILKQGGNDDGE